MHESGWEEGDRRQDTVLQWTGRELTMENLARAARIKPRSGHGSSMFVYVGFSSGVSPCSTLLHVSQSRMHFNI